MASNDLVKLLLEHDRSAHVTPAVILAGTKSARKSSTFMTTMLGHDPDLNITEESFLALLRASQRNGQDGRAMVDVLLKYDKKVTFTDAICTRIEQCPYDEEWKQLVYKPREDDICDGLLRLCALGV